jgi:hypothetical protein
MRGGERFKETFERTVASGASGIQQITRNAVVDRLVMALNVSLWARILMLAAALVV